MRVYKLLAPVWNIGSRIGGLHRSLNKYIQRLDISLHKNPKILDIGCGTGIISFALLEKFKDATILATDNNRAMLKTVSTLRSKASISAEQLLLGESDINFPFAVNLLKGGQITLPTETFDMIVASAVLEYAVLDNSIPDLLKLLKKGGCLLIVCMSDNFFGKMYGYMYQFKPVTNQIISILKKHGFHPEIIPFNTSEFPINLRRVGLLVKK